MEKKIRVNDAGEIVDFEHDVGDVICLPSLDQIRNFVYARKKQNRCKDALNLDLLEAYINDNRWLHEHITY